MPQTQDGVGWDHGSHKEFLTIMRMPVEAQRLSSA